MTGRSVDGIRNLGSIFLVSVRRGSVLRAFASRDRRRAAADGDATRRDATRRSPLAVDDDDR